MASRLASASKQKVRRMFIYTQENIQTRTQPKQIVNLAQSSHVSILQSDKFYLIAHFGKDERVPLARAETIQEAESLLRLILQALENKVDVLNLTEPDMAALNRTLTKRP